MRTCTVLRDVRVLGTWFCRGAEVLAAEGAWRLRPDAFLRTGDVVEPGGSFAAGLAETGTPRAEGEPSRVVVPNGVGTGLGDLICGSVAVRALHEELSRADGMPPEIDLVHIPTRQAARNYAEIFSRDPHVHRIIPAAVADWGRYHYVASGESLLADPAFATTPMIDYFLGRFGLDEYTGSRQPTLYPADPHTPDRIAASLREKKGTRTALVLNLHASGHRLIPVAVWAPVMEAWAARADELWLVAPPEKTSPVRLWIEHALPERLRGRVHDLSASAASWSHLLGVLEAADAVATPDTSILHAAGAMGKPCAGAFFSIEPSLRVNHYPTVEGWAPKVFRRGLYWGANKPCERDRTETNLEEDPDIVRPWKAARLTDWTHMLPDMRTEEAKR